MHPPFCVLVYISAAAAIPHPVLYTCLMTLHLSKAALFLPVWVVRSKYGSYFFQRVLADNIFEQKFPAVGNVNLILPGIIHNLRIRFFG